MKRSMAVLGLCAAVCCTVGDAFAAIDTAAAFLDGDAPRLAANRVSGFRARFTHEADAETGLTTFRVTVARADLIISFR